MIRKMKSTEAEKKRKMMVKKQIGLKGHIGKGSVVSEDHEKMLMKLARKGGYIFFLNFSSI
jgi:hypothetical protein